MPDKPILEQEPAKKDTAASTASSGPKVERPKGDVTVADSVFIEGQVITHAAAARIARRIGEEIQGIVHKGDLVVLLDDELIASLRAHRALLLQLHLFVKAYDSIGPAAAQLASFAAAAIAIGSATKVVESIADLAGLFGSDVQFSGRAVTVSSISFNLELAHHVRSNTDAAIYYPRIVTFEPGTRVPKSHSDLANGFGKVNVARKRAVERLRPELESMATLEKELLTLERSLAEETDAAKKKKLQSEIESKRVEVATARKLVDPDLILLENTDTQWHQLIKALNTPDETSKIPPLQRIEEAAGVNERFGAAESRPAWFLYSKIETAGGTYRVRKSLWRSLIWGDGVSFSGGVVASYGLFDKAGMLAASRTHRYLTPLTDFPDIEGDPAEINSIPEARW